RRAGACRSLPLARPAPAGGRAAVSGLATMVVTTHGPTPLRSSCATVAARHERAPRLRVGVPRAGDVRWARVTRPSRVAAIRPARLPTGRLSVRSGAEP